MFICDAPYMIDGDTVQCSHGGRVRLARIDAPEISGHCRPGRDCAQRDPFASKAALVALIDRRALRCEAVSASPRGGSSIDYYGRTVARCSVGGTDIGTFMIAHGFAMRWPCT